MPRVLVGTVLGLVMGGASVVPAAAGPTTWLHTITGQAESHHGYQRTGSGYCDIVVKRPGGNPTQDMTGSIGHAKSYQSNGGPARKRICQ